MSDQLNTPELPAIGLVSDLSAEDRALLSSYGEFVTYQENEVVIREGAPQNTLFFLVSGVLHARRAVGEREILMGRIERGQWFGEVNILDPSAASASVVAVRFSQVWRISRESLVEFIQNNHSPAIQLLISIGALLSQRLRQLQRKLDQDAELGATRASLEAE